MTKKKIQGSLTFIILTLNEEKHIARCINSIKELADEIYIVDSYSTDNTVEIAKDLGAKVLQNTFINQAIQFNWALQHCPIKTEWVWRLDADEFLQIPETLNVSETLSKLPQTVSGVYVRRRIVFLGKTLLHGGWDPVWHLKLWRNGKAQCENRWMDEHMILTEGTSVKIDCIQVDENLNDLSWWINKHNRYATREMVDILRSQHQNIDENKFSPKYLGTSEQRKRWLKMRYVNLPLFLRPFLYFFYCYVLKMGFLDGKSGFVWYILQSFWYRFLVDAKIYELKLRFKNDPKAIEEHIQYNYPNTPIEKPTMYYSNF